MGRDGITTESSETAEPLEADLGPAREQGGMLGYKSSSTITNSNCNNIRRRLETSSRDVETSHSEEGEKMQEEYKSSMGDLFGKLESRELGSVLLFLSSRELLSWREVSKARRRLFASASHAIKHGKRLLLDLHHSGLQLQALARLTRDDDSRSSLRGGETKFGYGISRRDNVALGADPLPSTRRDVSTVGGVGGRLEEAKSLRLESRKGAERPLPGCVWSVAHRGSSATHEGNSLPAFVEAVRVGADVIELDVVLCKTGEVVVHHDAVLGPSCLPLRNLGFDYIRATHAHIVTIVDVLECTVLRDSDVRIYFDLKGDGIVRPLMKVVLRAVARGGWQASRLIVASFNQFDLLEVNAFLRANPEVAGVATAVIMDSVPISLAREMEAVGASWISVGKTNLKPEFIRDARDRGIGVMAWTVNSLEEIAMVMRTGVDAIVTDYPEKVAVVSAKAATGNASTCSSSPIALDNATAMAEESGPQRGTISVDRLSPTHNRRGGGAASDCSSVTGRDGGGGDAPSRLPQTLKALYRSLWGPRRALVSAAAEAKAMRTVCTKAPIVGAFVASSPQGNRVMKELHPSVLEAEALAVELLEASIFSPVAREAAERAFSDSTDGLSTASSSPGHGNESRSDTRNGRETGPDCWTKQIPGRGGVTLSDDGNEEELFEFEKAWLRQLAEVGGI